ncbi:hypothetical protein P8452_43096 [Trifolium repens]|nr:hypothetical protein P8452_43096 [Trifolium repens]
MDSNSSLLVMIYLYDGGSYEGESDSSLATAKLRQVDDFINVNPAVEKSFHLRPYSSHFNLVPGHAIVVVGHYFAKPFDLMAAPGEFILFLQSSLVRNSCLFLFGLDRCDIDCKELFMGTYMTRKCGEGGTLINPSGEVICIIFYYEFGFSTPFMPINIAQRCWEHYKRYGRLRQPSLGVVATNFYSATVYHIEKVIQKFPSSCNGVLVEKVIQGSSADSAGLHLNVVIVRCGGKTVHSFLEFLEMMWDKKVGDVLQLSVVRASQNDLIHVNMVVDDVTVENFNRWPKNH